MKKSNLWKLAAILACATTLVAAGCTGCKSSKDMDASEIKEKVRAFYGENKEITDGNYDQSLAVKCSGGTFVGKLADSTIVFRGIPFVGLAVPRRQGQGMAAIRLGEQAGDGLRRVQHPYRKGISEENRGLGQDLPLDQVLRLLNRTETRKTGLFLL